MIRLGEWLGQYVEQQGLLVWNMDYSSLILEPCYETGVGHEFDGFKICRDARMPQAPYTYAFNHIAQV